MNKPIVAATLCGLLLAACSQGGGAKSDPNDPYAGLDKEILAWRGDLEAHHSTCATKIDGKGCAEFQVTCKAEQTIDEKEKAKGVTAQVVASMTFNARNADGSSGKPGSAFAVFSKAGDAWTRSESPPVNMTTCAPV